MPQHHIWPWSGVAPAVATAIALAALGLFGLPLVFGGLRAAPDVEWAAGAWLAAAVVLSLGLLALAPALTHPLAGALDRAVVVLASSGVPARRLDAGATHRLAQVLVVAAVLVVVPLVLRRPAALVVGGDRNAAAVEATIAAGALALILVLLVWMHQLSRPVLQAAAVQFLDVLAPTVGTPTQVTASSTAARTPMDPQPPTQLADTAPAVKVRRASTPAPSGAVSTQLADATHTGARASDDDATQAHVG